MGSATLFFLAFAACLVAWAAIIERVAAGHPILPYQPRRRVPWEFWDLLAVALFYIAVAVAVFHSGRYIFGLVPSAPLHDAAPGETSTVNPIIQVLTSGNWVAMVLCAATAIVVAPVAEEFFFRVLLQGWLEKVDRTWRRRFSCARRWMPAGAMPIFVSSLFFAAQHVRLAAPAVNAQLFTMLLASDGIARVLAIIFSVVFLRYRVGATALDFGWAPKEILADVRLGLFAFMAIATPIFGSLLIVSQLLPKEFAPDPVPIFFFAIALGLLYNRTHRAAPSIALHMALNVTSLAMVFLSSFG